MTDHDTARDALAERLLQACVASPDLLHVSAGARPGLYEALAAGPLSVDELAGLRQGRCSLGTDDPRRVGHARRRSKSEGDADDA